MPQHADVLIIGSGPAGAATAIQLSQSGLRVLLVDRATFPRDKVCGDALIPDALAALARLGLDAQIAARARRLDGVHILAPNQRTVVVPGPCACLPRRELDECLRRTAVERGVRFEAGWHADGPLRNPGGTVAGAAFRSAEGDRVLVHAPITVLATGAAAVPLTQFGVCERTTASATAARFYIQTDEAFARDVRHLTLSYDRTICPGYGWIFPGPDAVFNVGIGYFHDARRPPPDRNVRTLLDRFLARVPLAAALVRHGKPLTSLKGAPLRTTLCGARLAEPGLMVVGEAAGTTYGFSGEGIGKAMESGMIAARCIAESPDPATAPARYAAAIRSAFGDRFRAYRTAQDWLGHPTLMNLLAWRARRGRFVTAQLEGLFQETTDPRTLFSPLGMARALLR